MAFCIIVLLSLAQNLSPTPLAPAILKRDDSSAPETCFRRLKSVRSGSLGEDNTLGNPHGTRMTGLGIVMQKRQLP
jgi:hypothetical protein